MSFEKKPIKYYLQTVGVLTAIGVVSAALITSLNLLTGPVIQERREQAQSAAFKEVFPTLTEVSDATLMAGQYVKEYRVAYEGSEELGKIIRAEGQNSRASYNLMIGITGDGDDPSIAKVAIVEQEMTPGYDTTFKAYYDAFAADPSDANLEAYKGTGATLSCGLFRDMVKEAKDMYAGISGGVSEDFAIEISTIFGTTYTYADKDDRSVDGGTYLKKYYPLYNDAGNLNEAARIYSLRYSGDDGKLGLAIGLSGDQENPVLAEKAYVLQNTLVENGTTGEVSTADFSGIYTTLVDEAKAHYQANGLDNLAAKSKNLFSTAKSTSDATKIDDVSIVTSALLPQYRDKPFENTGTGELVEHWTVFDEASAELGEVYLCSMTLHFSEPEQYLEAHGDATYLVSFSYESETVKFGKMQVLTDTMSRGPQWEESYVANYNANPSGDVELTANATISASASQQLTLKAAEHYSNLKKGA